MKPTLLFLIVLSLGFSSCKKDGLVQRKRMLRGVWQATEYYFTYDTIAYRSIAALGSCGIFGRIDFKKNGTLLVPTCRLKKISDDEYDWEMPNDNSLFITDRITKEQTSFTIEELSDDVLHLSDQGVNAGKKATINITYRHE